jgi:hypothetical protein
MPSTVTMIRSPAGVSIDDGFADSAGEYEHGQFSFCLGLIRHENRFRHYSNMAFGMKKPPEGGCFNRLYL